MSEVEGGAGTGTATGIDEIAASADWRRLDIRMLLVHPVNELIRFLPLVIGTFVVGSSEDNGGLWWHIGGVAVPILLGVARFASTSFRITGSQIELRHGVFSKNVLTAPLDRVRSVEVTASPIHRILGLAKVKIGTGSATTSGGEKLELDSLRGQDARALRIELLHWSGAVHEVEATTGEGPAVQDDVLLRLDPAWARYAPLTTSGLAIAGGLVVASSQFIGRVVNRVARQLDLGERVQQLPLWVAILAALVTAVLAISVLSAVAYVLANWGFTLSRDRGGRSFHVRSGLFTTRETSIDRERVRGLEIHEPLGLRLAGGGRLTAIVTGLRRSKGSTSLVPPAPRRVVVAVGEAVLEETGPFTTVLVPHGPAARRRRYARSLVGAFVVAAFLGWFTAGSEPWVLPVPLLVLAAAVPLARDRYAGLGHALTEHYLIVRSGSFRGRRDALQRTGIIGWNLRQSWFQRRVGVVHLTATTSAGRQGYTAYDIPEGTAVALADEAVPGLVSQFLR